MDQVEGKYEDGAVILTETVKLLNFTIGAGSRRVSQIFAKLFTKHWITREISLVESHQPNGHVLKHCHKDSKASDNDIVSVPLDEVIAVRHLDKSKKKNVMEIIFLHQSILLSFKSFTIMQRWLSELINVTSVFVVFLMKSSNRSIKLGYYLLQFYINKMIFYNLTNKEMVWMWDVTHIHSYQYRKSHAEGDIVVGRFPGNKSGYFTFTGKRLGLVCQQMHILALNALSLADKNKIYKEVSYIPCADHPRPNAKHLHSHVPYCENFDSPTHMEAKSSKKKSLLRGSYSLNCLDEISIDNCYVDKMSCSTELRVFGEHKIADD